VSEQPIRTTKTVSTIRVVHVAKPRGTARKNPPSLGDLRAFVQACEGLPDDVHVHIQNGHLGESGRRDTTLSTSFECEPEQAEAIVSACGEGQ